MPKCLAVGRLIAPKAKIRIEAGPAGIDNVDATFGLKDPWGLEEMSDRDCGIGWRC